MYWCKKEDVMIVVAVALLFLVSGIFFFSDFSSESGITGAAVGVISEVGVPEESIVLGEEVGIQAVCSSWPCTCNDTINSSITLTSNLSNCVDHGLIINASNIILDCGGYSITGDSEGVNEYGLVLNNSNNVTIKNCTISGFYAGIYKYSSGSNNGNISLVYNIINNNPTGIYLNGPVDNSNISLNLINNSNSSGLYFYILNNSRVSYNQVYNSTYWGIYLNGSYNNTLINNTVGVISNNTGSGIFIFSGSNNFFNNNTIYGCPECNGIWVDTTSNNHQFRDNNIYQNGAYGFRIYNSSNITFINNWVYNNTVAGIIFYYSWNDTVLNNTIYNNGGPGISFLLYDYYINISNNAIYNNTGGGIIVSFFSTNNYFFNNVIYKNSNYGIHALSNNLIINNVVYNNTYGITFSNYNNITGNQIYNNTNYGLEGDSSNYNNISNNVIYGNRDSGIYLAGGQNNTVTNNQIENNTNSGIYSSSINATLQYNTLRGNTQGIYLDAEGMKVMYNNLSYNNYGFYVGNLSLSTNNDTNVSFNNIVGNNYSYYKVNDEDVVKFEYNWWNETTCGAISANITGAGAVDFDPFLNTSYPLGNSTSCPNQYCGMFIQATKTLNGSITNCSKNGIVIFGSNLTLNCQGNSILAVSGNNNSGIDISRRENVTLDNCIISNFQNGIYSYLSYNQSYTRNSITNCILGMFVVWGGNNTIFNNTISNCSGIDSIYGIGAGIGLLITNQNKIYNNILSNNSNSGTQLVLANYNTYENNSIINNILGYTLEGSNNNFTLETVSNNTNAILINSTNQAANNLFKKVNFTGNTLDFNSLNGYQASLTFINTSINKTKTNVSSGTIVYFKNYIFVNVSDNNQSALNNATVKAYNSLGLLEDTVLTETNGIAMATVTQFYRTSGVTYYLTPSTIITKKNNYTQNSTPSNLYGLANNEFVNVNLSLTSVNCNSTLYSNFDFGNNYNCNNIGFIIGTDDLVINGNGYDLTGNGSGVGINLNGKDNVTISNFRINNFTFGVSLLNVTNSNLYNLTLVNNSRGLIFNSSNNNTLYDSTLYNNSEFSVFVINDGGTNNSLVNVSINLSQVNVSGTANLFVKWYVDVNATYNSGLALTNANVYGYFNLTGVVDDYKVTSSTGIGRLTLTELKKNSSGITYLTPHNVTISFSLQGVNVTNSTTFNLSLTNKTKVNLSLILNCTSLTQNNTLTQSVILCPGTFNVRSIVFGADNINFTCDNTILNYDAPSPRDYMGYGITINTQNNIKISNCVMRNFENGILVYSSANISVINTNITANYDGIQCYHSTKLSLNNSELSSYIDLVLTSCNSSIIANNTFKNYTGTLLHNSPDNLFINNRFNSLSYGIVFDSDSTSSNNSFYNNNFSNNVRNVWYDSASDSSRNYFNTSVNVSGTMSAQGNEWSDYCDKGKDLNGDGYSDNVSSATANDWPYNSTTSSKINGLATDYAPKIITCPAVEQFLSSSGGGRTTTATIAAIAAPTVTPTTTTTYKKTLPTETPVDTYTPDEARKFIKTTDLTTTKLSNDITAVTVTLENTGTKKMYLFPELQQEIDDPYFIITRKTLGFSDSLLMKLSQIVSSGESISGRLLKAEIVNSKEITLNPGEKVDQVIEIKEGLAQPRQMKMQFTTNGISVNEKEFKIETNQILGTAVDIDSSKHSVDLYAVIVPEEKFGGTKTGNGITGAAIGLPIINTDEYFLELEVIKENADGTFTTKFNELYGPYKVKQTEPLIFAQQLEYGEKYIGKHVIRTKIYQSLQVVAENEFAIDLG